jgi:hypothetical protein
MRKKPNEPGERRGADRNNQLTTALDFLLEPGQFSLIAGPQSSDKTALCVSLVAELTIARGLSGALLSGRADQRRLSVGAQVDFLFIDSLPKTDWPEQAVSGARKMGTAVIATVQLPSDELPTRPTMSDLRGCESIARQADVVGFMVPPLREREYGHPDGPNRRRANLQLVKNREGPLETIETEFDSATFKFRVL